MTQSQARVLIVLQAVIALLLAALLAIQLGTRAGLTGSALPINRDAEDQLVLLQHQIDGVSDQIDQAKADWAAGRIALPPTDRGEFIPLPEEPKPRPEPMS